MRVRAPRDLGAAALLVAALAGCGGRAGPAPPSAPERRATPVTLAADAWHSCAQVQDTLRCWGTDPLDDGSGATSVRHLREPRLGVVVPRVGAVRDLDLGLRHGCAALANGALVCWGRVDGDPYEASPGPARVEAMPGPVDVVDVAVGSRHGCAVTRAGGVWCWGVNEEGQLGDGTHEPRAAPVDTELTGIAAVSANGVQTCALHRDGAVSCWGDLGGDHRLARSRPFPVRWITDAVEVSSGARTCIRRAGGEVECWSWVTLEGQPFTRPAPVLGLSQPRQISAGGHQGCAVEGDGRVLCWEWPTSAETEAIPSYPVPDVRDAVEVAVGDQHACARTGDPAAGSIVCWGADDVGQLGDGAPRIADRPLRVAGVASVVEVSAGAERTCVRQRSGVVRCWGEKILATQYLPVRAAMAGWSGTPAEVATAGDSEEIDATSRGVCTRTGARVVCQDSDELPDVLEGVRAVDLPLNHRLGCWITTAGRVSCRGVARWTECSSSTADCAAPQEVEGAADIVQLAVAETHGCGLDARGALWCWGGFDRWGPAQPARQVRGIEPMVGLAAGSRHACAWSAAGALWCWGANTTGEVGDGTTEARLTPTRVALAGPCVAAAGGEGFTCAALADGRVQCWGVGAEGQLGDGARVARMAPSEVVGLPPVDALAAGLAHTCARTREGEVWCWGRGFAGQLGQGIEAEREAPVRVVGLE